MKGAAEQGKRSLAAAGGLGGVPLFSGCWQAQRQCLGGRSWSRIKKPLGQKSGLFIKETIRVGRGEESGGAPRHVGPGSDDSTCLKTWGKDQFYCWNRVLRGGSCKLLSVALPSLRHLPALLTVESSEERRFEEWREVLGCQNLSVLPLHP